MGANLMKVVVFAATKGGVGKSTLAYNVAVEAAKTLGVLLIDLDPQQSLHALWLRRGERKNPLLVTNVLENVRSVRDAVDLLTAHGLARDLLIVDTPNSNIPLIRSAINAADAVVLPVQPSPMDLLAQEAVCDLVKEIGKGGRTLFALNRVDQRSTLGRQSMQWLATYYPGHPVVQIMDRAAYARGAIDGNTAGEIDKAAIEEIGVLWRKVREIVG